MARKGLNKRYVLILRWGAPCVLIALVLTAAVVLLSRRDDPAAANSDGTIRGLTSVLEREISEEMIRFRFEAVTEAMGIDFQHFPDTRRSLLPEDMGSGAAWGDYDDDGDPDLFLVNFNGSIRGDASSAAGACRLYRNDAGRAFVDVSEESGLALNVRGLGAAWADYDNDGDLDIYVSCYGPNVLMKNNGDGTFTDTTIRAGVGDASFSAGVSWADFDRDGNVDLYVCNYVVFEDDAPDDSPVTRQYGAEIPYTINPSSYLPDTNRLYRNNGDGTFRDVAHEAGVSNATGRSLEAAWFDFDDDGWIDLYVANDVSSNGVFRNMGDGTFADIGASSLAADYRGAMGLAVGDHDRDGDLDLFVTHWLAQENALFENMTSNAPVDDEGNRRLFFMDGAELAGLGHISLKTVGWANGFDDFDNDGHDDLWVLNGNTIETTADATKLKPQAAHFFWRDPERGFFEIGSYTCTALEEPMVARGGASADFDGDGRLDVVICRHGTSPLLLRNVSDNDHHWVQLDLRQTGRNTRALGARVDLRAGGKLYVAQVDADASYLSQHDTTIHFGLGETVSIDVVRVRWPDGTTEQFDGLAVDRKHRLVRSEGDT